MEESDMTEEFVSDGGEENLEVHNGEPAAAECALKVGPASEQLKGEQKEKREAGGEGARKMGSTLGLSKMGAAPDPGNDQDKEEASRMEATTDSSKGAHPEQLTISDPCRQYMAPKFQTWALKISLLQALHLT